jgi:hypothetical protein
VKKYTWLVGVEKRGRMDMEFAFLNLTGQDLSFLGVFASLITSKDYLDSLTRTFTAEVVRAMAGRRFITTNKCYIGLRPANTSIRDKVRIFFGAPVPLILHSKGEGYHLLVGEAYLHGAMEGEILKQDLKMSTFHLR